MAYLDHLKIAPVLLTIQAVSLPPTVTATAPPGCLTQFASVGALR
jgi:hypothetical protein